MHKTASFIATGLTSTIEFQSFVGTVHGPVVDDVKVTSCYVVICIG